MPESARLPDRAQEVIANTPWATVLMHALLDVDTAAHARKLGKLGLFIALPRRVRLEAEMKAINKAIDFVATRVPPGCRVEVETDTTLLAEHIIDWAGLKAA